MLTIGQSVVVDRAASGALLAALIETGHDLVGPTVRDGAIVLGPLSGIDDLPSGSASAMPGERVGDNGLADAIIHSMRSRNACGLWALPARHACDGLADVPDSGREPCLMSGHVPPVPVVSRRCLCRPDRQREARATRAPRRSAPQHRVA